MPIDLKCGCGWMARAKDEFAGKRVKCKECGVAVLVPKPPVPEEEGYEVVEEAEEVRPRPRPQPVREVTTDESPVRNLNPIPTPRTKSPKRPKIEYRPRDEDHSSSRGGGISLSPAAASGLGSILLGGVLIALGSSRGRVSIYGVVLVIIGLFTFIRALTGASED